MDSSDYLDFIFVDYRNCRSGNEQMEVLLDYRDRVLASKATQLDVLVDFSGQIASLYLIKHATQILKEIESKVNKYVVVGVADIQLIFIHTINHMLGSNMKAFKHLAQGVEYLHNGRNDKEQALLEATIKQRETNNSDEGKRD